MEERLSPSAGELHTKGTQHLVIPRKCPLTQRWGGVGGKGRAKRKEGGRKKLSWFFPFFPPKAIVKGAGKCGFQEKGGGINLEAKGNNQNKL